MDGLRKTVLAQVHALCCVFNDLYHAFKIKAFQFTADRQSKGLPAPTAAEVDEHCAAELASIAAFEAQHGYLPLEQEEKEDVIVTPKQTLLAHKPPLTLFKPRQHKIFDETHDNNHRWAVCATWSKDGYGIANMPRKANMRNAKKCPQGGEGLSVLYWRLALRVARRQWPTDTPIKIACYLGMEGYSAQEQIEKIRFLSLVSEISGVHNVYQKGRVIYCTLTAEIRRCFMDGEPNYEHVQDVLMALCFHFKPPFDDPFFPCTIIEYCDHPLMNWFYARALGLIKPDGDRAESWQKIHAQNEKATRGSAKLDGSAEDNRRIKLWRPPTNGDSLDVGNYMIDLLDPHPGGSIRRVRLMRQHLNEEKLLQQRSIRLPKGTIRARLADKADITQQD